MGAGEASPRGARAGSLVGARVLREVVGRDLVLIGDYHPDPAAKEWMHALATRLLLDGRRLVFGFELVEARYQALLDAYWQGRVSEQRLLAGLRYQESWGLPWKTFRCLFRLARMAQVRCLALDDRQGPREGRDAVAARRLHASLQRHPGALHLVLVGETHLEEQALPAALRDAGLETAPLSVLLDESVPRRGGDCLSVASGTPGDRRAWRDGLEERCLEDPEAVLLELRDALAERLGRSRGLAEGVHLFVGERPLLERFLARRGAARHLALQRPLLRHGLLYCADPPTVFSAQARPASLAAAAGLLLFPAAPRRSSRDCFAARVRAEVGRQLLFPSRGPRHLAEQRGAFLGTREVRLSFAAGHAEMLALRWVNQVQRGTLTGAELGERLAALDQ